LRTRIQNRVCLDKDIGALLMSPFPRELGNTVKNVGDKADGVLVGMDGKYSSMASNFR
jgi:hypothetical protein